MEPERGKASGRPSPGNVSTRLQRIAELARESPGMAFTTLAHHVDIEFLRAAYDLTRKDGAVGVDGQTAEAYTVDLEGNLRSLLDRFKSGSYYAPPVRRVHIPKGDGTKTRPIGIPTFEDKVLQRAVAMVVEAVYEQDFLECSYGFRPGKSAHQALEALWRGTMKMNGGWVVEVDIRSFFDTLEVVVCAVEGDARRVLEVLPKRFGKYGLELHPEKTRLVRFGRPRNEDDEPGPGSFDFLGFTHHWGKSRTGKWVRQVEREWRKWLSRRSQRAALPWERFGQILSRYRLPPIRVVHSIYRNAANAMT
jgi:hypothetical protein